jgi:hypothetical protein
MIVCGAIPVIIWFCKSSLNASVFAPDAVEIGVSPLS